MSNDNGNTLLALLTGAAIGVGIGILYAPDKGTETRSKIKQKALDTKHDVAESISRLTEELSRTADAKKIDFEKKLEKTISNMSYKADDIIVALENKLEELRKKNAQLQK
ncbi:MAG: YtxH domain-containing protein [Sediminicola sp.]|tara:strand:+ start:22589 stop:22918 length:330 start_codon:yes stop_codon:yes gene_type:complete